MTTYVDTSALVKLVVDEPGSATARGVWQTGDDLVASRLLQVEVRAALGAAARRGRVDADAVPLGLTDHCHL